MRLVKMLGLAMVAAVAAMAFIGTGSASAQVEHWVVLCKENPVELCPELTLYKHIPIDATLEELTNAKGEKALHAVLLGQTNELCKKGSVNGEVTTTSPLAGKITSVTFGECTPCTAVKTNASAATPYSVEVIHDLTGEHLWLEIVKGSPILTTFEGCSFGVKCRFETTEVHLDVNNTAGGLPLVLTLENVFTLQAGDSVLLCGAQGKWDANYLTECLEPAGTRKNCWLALDRNKEA